MFSAGHAGLILLIFYPTEYNDLYGCQNFNAQKIQPIFSYPILSIFQLLLALLAEFLYALCMYSIWRNRQHSCYKILFYIGIIDMLGMIVGAIVCSLLALTNSTFCDSPNFQYINGGLAMAFWFAETTAEFILAFNRCMDVISPTIATFIFKGNRTWYLMLIPSIYAAISWLFTAPVVFSSKDFAFFFNPYQGYIPDNNLKYVNYMHSFNNTMVSLVLCTTYGIFFILWLIKIIKFKAFKINSTNALINNEGKQVVVDNNNNANSTANAAIKFTFVQVLLISMFNAFAAGLGEYMQYFQIFPELILLAQMTYVLTHAAPPFIYLLCNKTIRRDIRTLILKVFFADIVAKVNGVTIVKPAAQNGGNTLQAALSATNPLTHQPKPSSYYQGYAAAIRAMRNGENATGQN